MVTINRQKINCIIADRKISIKDLLVKAGCSAAVWRNITGGKPVRLSNAGKVADALGVPAEQLIQQ